MTIEGIKDNPKTVLALFSGDYCHTCKKVHGVIDEVIAQFPDKIDFKVINVTENTELAVEYEVLNLPTLLIFKGGQVTERVAGFISKEKLMAKLNLPA